jgi:hypothetical protein
MQKYSCFTLCLYVLNKGAYTFYVLFILFLKRGIWVLQKFFEIC